MNRFSAKLTGESARQFSLWERISPSLGNWLIACSMTGNHDWCKNPTTADAARSAHTNCTSSNRRHDARAKAATPGGVNGCHALCDFSTEASTVKRSNGVRERWEDYSALARGVLGPRASVLECGCPFCRFWDVQPETVAISGLVRVSDFFRTSDFGVRSSTGSSQAARPIMLWPAVLVAAPAVASQ